ncbi:MAG: hypothetical protein HUU34_15660 [Saprospiraceae bacterium]|nr:hypothetical protein [Saprospiraceae bacterium]
MQLAQVFSDEQIVYTLCRELSWLHLLLIMYMDDPLKRDFYIEMCKLVVLTPLNERLGSQSRTVARSHSRKVVGSAPLNDRLDCAVAPLAGFIKKHYFCVWLYEIIFVYLESKFLPTHR